MIIDTCNPQFLSNYKTTIMVEQFEIDFSCLIMVMKIATNVYTSWSLSMVHVGTDLLEHKSR